LRRELLSTALNIVATNSGTSALHLIIRALGIGEVDE